MISYFYLFGLRTDNKFFREVREECKFQKGTEGLGGLGSPEVKEGLKGQGGSESPEGLGSSEGPESHTVLEVDLEGPGGS